MSPGDLGSSKYIRQTEKMLSAKGFYKSKQFPEQSILFVCIGSTIGKCGIAAVSLASNQQINAVLPYPHVLPDFVYYVLCAASRRISASAGEQAVPIVSKSLFAKTLIPIPPTLAEQHAIAEALSDADAVIEALERLIAKKRVIKQGAMQELLTGKRRLPRFKGEWHAKKLAELAEIISGGTPSTSQSLFWNGEILWCTPSDVTRLDGYKYLTGTQRKITLAGLESSAAELISANSVVMTTRATIGECAINTVEVSTNQGLKSFIPRDFVDGEFLYYLLLNQKGGLIELCGGSTFLEISKSQVERYTVNLPETKDEQSAIAVILSEMDAEIDALDSKLAKARH